MIMKFPFALQMSEAIESSLILLSNSNNGLYELGWSDASLRFRNSFNAQILHD